MYDSCSRTERKRWRVADPDLHSLSLDTFSFFLDFLSRVEYQLKLDCYWFKEQERNIEDSSSVEASRKDVLEIDIIYAGINDINL